MVRLEEYSLLTFLLFACLAGSYGKGQVENRWSDDNCEEFKELGMCKTFKKYCRRTCRGWPHSTMERKVKFKDPIRYPIKTRCSKSCGGGTRYRFVSDNCTAHHKLRCKRIFEACNTEPCEHKACKSNQEERYGGDTGCCKQKGPATPRKQESDELPVTTQWPWMAIVTSFGDVCGGVLIHREWVLTPAHCLTTGDSDSKINPYRISVYLGIQDVSEASYWSRYRTRTIFVHPEYANLRNDLGLIKLTRPSSRRTAAPLSLPRGEETPFDSTCYALGWGFNGTGIRYGRPRSLDEVPLQILDMTICRNAYEQDPAIAAILPGRGKSRWTCAGSLTNKNEVCRGDRGVALVCQRCTSCDWYLSGFATFEPNGACGRVRSPGMYMKISAHEAWIHKLKPSLNESKVECPYWYGP